MLIAILDADALFPMVLRDTLLSAAGAGCFQLHWTARILDEVTRNLISDYGMAEAVASKLRVVMVRAFPDAEVEGWEHLESSMSNHPKDRHVAAAAVVAEASIIVTSNLRDFQSLPDGLAALSPDQFLLRLLDQEPERIVGVLLKQAALYRKPPLDAVGLLSRLAKAAPIFSARITTLLARVNSSDL
jgi:PIN domain